MRLLLQASDQVFQVGRGLSSRIAGGPGLLQFLRDLGAEVGGREEQLIQVVKQVVEHEPIADQGCLLATPTETPQLSDTAADPHRNPTDETAHSGTLVMRVKDTENSRSAASMRVSWAVGGFSR